MLEEEYRKLAEAKYGTLSEPRFDFVAEAVRLEAYAPLLGELSSAFAIEDDTDTNDDVSFCMHLRRGQNLWILRLSMLARLAALMRVRGESVIVVGSAGTSSATVRSGDEQEIVGALERHAVAALDRAELEKSVPVQLYNVDASRCRVYQAFFSDTDILPWESDV